MDTQTFTYDSLNRLTAVTSSIGNNESFSYDGFGNITNLNGTGYSYDSGNHRTNLTYDANGNVTQGLAPDNQSQAHYAWDLENRMTSYVVGSTTVTGSIGYDPWGKRVQATVSGQALVYFYSVGGQRLGTWVIQTNGTLAIQYDNRTGKNAVNRCFLRR